MWCMIRRNPAKAIYRSRQTPGRAALGSGQEQQTPQSLRTRPMLLPPAPPWESRHRSGEGQGLRLPLPSCGGCGQPFRTRRPIRGRGADMFKHLGAAPRSMRLPYRQVRRGIRGCGAGPLARVNAEDSRPPRLPLTPNMAVFGPRVKPLPRFRPRRRGRGPRRKGQ